MSDQATADPYAGIDLPKPPRGYRLAKWGETYDGSCLLWWRNTWNRWSRLVKDHYVAKANPVNSIFAVPKPRIRIELEQGEEVE